MAGSDALFGPSGRAGRARLRALTAGSRPLALEVGFGHGWFLVGLAAAHPELDAVGIEVQMCWVHKAEARARQAGVDNVLTLKGDARVVLALDVPPGRLDHVFVMFPDPWWKPRHQRRRRLVTPEFLDLLGRVMRPGGTLLLRTDVPAYLETSRAFVTAHAAFVDGDPAALPAGLPPTRRERRCAREETPVFEHVWQRR